MSKKKEKIKSTSRRNFIKILSGAAASAALLGTFSCKPGGDSNNGNSQPTVLAPRVKKTNPYVTGDGRPILVSVRGNDFGQMLAAGLSLLGGLDLLIDNNQDVLINPNLNHTDPYPGVSSVDSIVSILDAVKQVTGGQVSVGDMGWEGSASVYGNLGVETAVTNAGGLLVTFSNAYRVRRSTWDSSKPNFRVYDHVYDAPILLSTCVVKRHKNAWLTCAIKNNVGTIVGSHMSSTREYLHNRSNNFLEELAEIAGLVNPELVIVDARSILTEKGPMLSDGGTVVDVGEVVISGDIVAADAYCAQMMEANDAAFSASNINLTLQRAVDLGLGISDLNQVEIISISV